MSQIPTVAYDHNSLIPTIPNWTSHRPMRTTIRGGSPHAQGMPTFNPENKPSWFDAHIREPWNNFSNETGKDGFTGLQKWFTGGKNADGSVTNPIIPTVLNTGMGLADTWLAFQNLDIAKQELAMNKEAHALNMAGTRNATNAQLQQYADFAASRNANFDKEAYLQQYKV